ncbi:MAG: hypothetical protein WHS44_11705 [Fimbriimonadales bacterium]|nr:MAG: hypothetical protein KatS3mg018_2401 [Fimbriimonadales bacterium]
MRGRNFLTWLVAVATWATMVYALWNAQSLIALQGAALAKTLPPEGVARITQATNLREAPLQHEVWRYYRDGRLAWLEKHEAGQKIIVEWETVHGAPCGISYNEPVSVRAIESKQLPQQGMTLHIYRKTSRLGCYLVLRDSEGASVGVWEVN